MWASLDELLASSKFPSFQQLKLIIDVKSLHWDAHKFGLRFEDSDSDDEDAPSTVVIPPLVTKNPWPEYPPPLDDVATMIAEQMPTLGGLGDVYCFALKRWVDSDTLGRCIRRSTVLLRF